MGGFDKKKIIQLVLSALMALVFVNFYLKQVENKQDNQYSKVSVLVAAHDISSQKLFQSDFTAIKEIPYKFLQPGAIVVKLPDLKDRPVKGKVSVTPIPEGAQITQWMLAEPSPEKTGLVPLIPPGKRGYILRLGNTDVSQFIRPGDYVDIMATFSTHDAKQDGGMIRATVTLLQRVLVLSVGKDLKPINLNVGEKKEQGEALVLSLALSPNESQRLALAQTESQGEIAVVVRPTTDADVAPIQPVDTNNLLYGTPPGGPSSGASGGTPTSPGKEAPKAVPGR